MPRWAWIVLVAASVAAALYRDRLRTALKRTYANVRAFDLPSAGMYDALVASALEGFYTRVASEVAAVQPHGKVLEVGSGPGRLAVQLAREAPDTKLTGVDISDAMVERAARRAAEAGLAERVRFEVGDVSALPFADIMLIDGPRASDVRELGLDKEFQTTIYSGKKMELVRLREQLEALIETDN